MIHFALRCSLLLLLCESYCISSAQNHKIDSLLNELTTAKEDTGKVTTLINLSFELTRIAKYDEARNNADLAMALAEQLKFKKGIGAAYLRIGELYWRRSNYDEALKNYFAALNIYEIIGYKKRIAHSYISIGDIYDDQGNYPEALKYYLASLKIMEEIGDKHGIARTYNEIGILYRQQHNQPEALKYLLLCLKLIEEIGDKYEIAATYDNLGNVYADLRNYPEALKSYSAALKLHAEFGDKHGMAISYNNMGTIYEVDCNYSEAIKNYMLGLKLFEETGDTIVIANSYLNLGKLYGKLNKIDKANKYATNGLILAKGIGNLEVIKFAYNVLSTLDSTMGNYALALEHFKLSAIYNDSLYNETSSKQLAEMKEKYEAEKKDKEIVVLNNEKAIQTQDLKKQKQAKKYLLAVIILFITLSFFIYRNFITQRKLNKLYRISAEKQMAELQLQSLRAQLNPHFMFNSLNAIQELIVMEENEKSQSYLELFAQLLRQLLENASQPFIPLRKEINFLEHYLSLEGLRLPGLQYSIKIDPQLNAEHIMVPNMMLQPYIENALWHGLRHKQGDKRLQLQISRQNGSVHYDIKDNGVGRKKAEEMKSLYRKEHRSKGMELLAQRFDLLAQEYGQSIQTKITDLTENGDAAGTLVEIIVPVSFSEKSIKNEETEQLV